MIEFPKRLKMVEQWDVEHFEEDCFTAIEVGQDPLSKDKPVFIEIYDEDGKGNISDSVCMALTIEQSKQLISELVSITYRNVSGHTEEEEEDV